MTTEFIPADSTEFACELIHYDQAIVVELSGELDIATASRLRDAFVHPDVLSAQAVRVDLTQVSFLESTTIGLIVSACKHIRASGGSFSVICGEGSPRRSLEVMGLIEYLQIDGGDS